MALVKRTDGTFLINQNPLQFGLIRQARALFNLPLQTARDIAAQLRGAGIEAYAASEMGTENDDAWKPPTVQVDTSVVWPSTWRIEVEQLSENRFVHKFLNGDGVQSSVTGSTPQQVIDRLSARLDFDARQYLASITPLPQGPTVVVEAPVDDAPKKFLRPGSRTGTPYTPEEAEYLAAQRAAREVPVTLPIEIQYLQFYNTASSAEISARRTKDKEFFAWMKTQNLFGGVDNARNQSL